MLQKKKKHIKQHAPLFQWSRPPFGPQPISVLLSNIFAPISTTHDRQEYKIEDDN